MTEAHLSCYTRRDNGPLRLALEGTLDVVTAPQATTAIQGFLGDHGPDIILDMARLNFIDSRGVGVLLTAAKAAKEAKGKIFVHEPAIPVRKILEACGLSTLFPPVPADLLAQPSPAAAAAAAAPQRPVIPTARASSKRPARRAA